MSSHWLQTYTGRRFDIVDLNPENVYIEDIAHSLSMKCRFAGHTKGFYSVAQHSVLVSENVFGLNELYIDYARKWGLLHDAHEAYFTDLVSPYEGISELNAIVTKIKSNLDLIIREAFGLLDIQDWGIVKDTVATMDSGIAVTESQQLMSLASCPWDTCKCKECPKFTINPIPPRLAKEGFIKRFESLWRWK